MRSSQAREMEEGADTEAFSSIGLYDNPNTKLKASDFKNEDAYETYLLSKGPELLELPEVRLMYFSF